jgi:hypothetical protein
MRDVQCMRTTLNIDDDVLSAVRELSSLYGRTLGEVLSDLARAALTRNVEEVALRNGVPLLDSTSDAGLVTSEDVARLMEES